ncbi:MAG: DUF11 domain-containing protein [Sphingobacteriales bacterium]|nr:MAG: DUF11 domain-containing protein [Sphingobacteriales bacterium]
MKKRLLLLLFFFLSAISFSQNLVVVNTDNSAYYIPGETSTYTVTVLNQGPAQATGVTLNMAVPAGIEYFSWYGSNGTSGIYDPLVSNIGTLDVGQMVTFIVSVEVPASFNAPLTTQAVVSSTSVDPDLSCPACSDTNVKAVGADIEVVNTNGQTQYVPGSTGVYTVTVTNNGPLTAANIQVTNTFPAGVTVTSWTGSNGTGQTNLPVSDMIPSPSSRAASQHESPVVCCVLLLE